METNELHPVIRKEFTRIRDWQAWKTLWDEARHPEQLIGLLHIAFDVEGYGAAWADRLRFLLRVADGYCDGSRRSSDVAMQIADKAFKVLCDRYFKQRCGVHERDSTSPVGDMSPELFGTVLWFFHDHDRRPFGRNLPRDGRGHHDDIARRYVRYLIQQSWTQVRAARWEGVRIDEETEAAFIAARPQYVVLLHELEELQLLHSERRPPIEEPTLEALRKIAFHDYSGKQVYRTAEEAVGTYAGQQLLILEATLRERARKQRLADALRLKAEADRALEEASQS